tara:strand:+ start:2095 stop:2226 length:132 start_codon:yes stop_codon:yes gene_type:complete
VEKKREEYWILIIGEEVFCNGLAAICIKIKDLKLYSRPTIGII